VLATNFVKSVSLAEEVHSLGLELETLGHFQFFGRELICNLDLRTLQGHRDSMVDQRRRWQDAFEKVCVPGSRLLLLDYVTLGRCCETFVAVTSGTKLKCSLDPYIWLLFPEYHALEDFRSMVDSYLFSQQPSMDLDEIDCNEKGSSVSNSSDPDEALLAFSSLIRRVSADLTKNYTSSNLPYMVPHPATNTAEIRLIEETSTSEIDFLAALPLFGNIVRSIYLLCTF